MVYTIENQTDILVFDKQSKQEIGYGYRIKIFFLIIFYFFVVIGAFGFWAIIWSISMFTIAFVWYKYRNEIFFLIETMTMLLDEDGETVVTIGGGDIETFSGCYLTIQVDDDMQRIYRRFHRLCTDCQYGNLLR